MDNAHDVKEELQQGIESAKIKSHKQALVTDSLQAIILLVSVANNFSFAGKLIIFVALSLLLGAVMSSSWMKKKLKS